MKTILSVFLLSSLSLFAQQSYYYSFGKKVTLTKLPEQRALNHEDISYYQNEKGQKIGVKKEVIVGCDDYKACEEALKNYEIISIKKLSKNIYLLKLPKKSDPFDIANFLYEEKSIKYAHPNFIKPRKKR